MRSLRPMTTLLLGPALLAVTLALSAGVAEPSFRTARGVAIGLGVGFGFGVLLFAPIAIAGAFRTSLAGVLRPRWFQVQWYISLAMALSLGYLFASVRHHAFDGLSLLAIALVFFGALAKVMLGVIAQSNEASAA